MRKSGWTVAAGLSSLVLLLTACGGSANSTSATGAASGTVTQGTVSSSSTAGPTSSATSSKSTAKAKAKAKAKSSSSSSKQTAQAQPSTNPGVTFPAIGTTVLIVQHSNLGWVMATAKGMVVYTYAKDSKGGPPSCTGSCAAYWAPVTGVPKAGPADNFPGTFGVVTGTDGKKVITYNGYPLYVFVSAPALSTKGNGLDGAWHVIILSANDISGA